MSKSRFPTDQDVTLLARTLRDNGVEYVVIGGAAMALHGFPRMTKDIDLLLPVDRENNGRLLKALESVPSSREALAHLNRRYMDRGHSTALEGDVPIDILYVAAGKSFEELRPHVKRIDFKGVPVWTLDVDGMLISKNTNRQSDVADRLKLESLRTALFDALRHRREEGLHALSNSSSAPVRFFGEMARLALRSGPISPTRWKTIEDQALEKGAGQVDIDVRDLAEVLCGHSPGAVYPSRQAAIRKTAALLSKQGPQGTVRRKR